MIVVNFIFVRFFSVNIFISFSSHRRATLLSARQGMMSARGDFLNYALSLMRSHNDEHSDVLPVLDVCSLKHVAYVFQALIYWIKAMNQQTTLDTPQLERKRYTHTCHEVGLRNTSLVYSPCVNCQILE
jgi:E3 ubiquitin-protein ligase EDD1